MIFIPEEGSNHYTSYIDDLSTIYVLKKQIASYAAKGLINN